MPTNDHGGPVSPELVITSAAFRTPPCRQLPLWPAAVPNPWSRAARAATWLEIAQALPANLSVEFTAEHGWRIVPLSVEARRALELLDISEGEVIPDPVMLERRRRHVEAQLMLDQARAVLRSVQVDNETRAAVREQVA